MLSAREARLSYCRSQKNGDRHDQRATPSFLAGLATAGHGNSMFMVYEVAQATGRAMAVQRSIVGKSPIVFAYPLAAWDTTALKDVEAGVFGAP